MNFAWCRFVAMNRLGFRDREARFLSFGEFHELYREYQRVFDVETVLRKSGSTYQQMAKAAEEREKPISW